MVGVCVCVCVGVAGGVGIGVVYLGRGQVWVRAHVLGAGAGEGNTKVSGLFFVPGVLSKETSRRTTSSRISHTGTSLSRHLKLIYCICSIHLLFRQGQCVILVQVLVL